MKRHLLILFALCFALLSCNNDDDNTSQNPIDQLPPATQTGENTFGYLVNGEPIVVTSFLKITAIYQQNQLQLGGAIENQDFDIDIKMFVGGPIQENISYSLVGLSSYDDYNIISACEYNIEDSYEGSITFTNVDEVNYIISGIFNFSTVTDSCEDIKITNGRFDVQYIP